MSLRSDPAVNPSKPDPVTRNQPDMEKMDTNDRTGTENMPGSYPSSPKDSTSSGGYSATPDKTWSDRAQRGTDMPLGSEITSSNAESTNENNTGLIDQSTSGIDLKDEILDAIQGRDKNSPNDSEDVWGIEKGAEKDF